MSAIISKLTDNTITLQSGMGVALLTIRNKSSVAGTITSANGVAGLPAAVIDLAENDVLTIGTGGKPLSGYIITAPTGCTLDLVGDDFVN